jgi:hypothetical protein
MNRKFIPLGILIAAIAGNATAQTTVTTSGTTSSGTVPVFNGTATVTNSPISVSGSNVGIGTPTPATQLHIVNQVGSVNPLEIDVNGNGGIKLTRTNSSHPGSGIIQIDTYGTIQISADNTITFTTNTAGTPRYGVNILTNGFVGIGNNIVPGSMLTVQASTNDTTASTLNITNLNNSSLLYVRNDGSIGVGTTSPAYTLDVSGPIHTSAALYLPDGTKQTTAWTGVLCGGDYAEAVRAAGEKQSYEPGDVLVLTSDAKGDVQKSSKPYSTMVAGIYATKPGAIGRRQSLKNEAEEVPMAMVGIVPTKVTAKNGAIHRGDLLVSSSIPGYAMKGTDRSRMLGAVIGKAMGSLDSGEGILEVLVTLQ